MTFISNGRLVWRRGLFFFCCFCLVCNGLF